MNGFAKWCALAAVAIGSSGCASIIKGGSPQSVSIKSSPSEADVKIVDVATGNTLHTGKTPFIVSLEKSRGYFKGAKYKIVAEKAGFVTREVVIDSSANGWYIAGNLLFGGLIGWLIVDPATGAMWTLDPGELALDLQPDPALAPAPQEAAASQPVAIMSLDELQARHPAAMAKLQPID